MNISRHIKNIGFISFKFLTRFSSKRQFTGFLSSNCQSTNLNFDWKIQISLYFFCFFVKCLICLNAKSSVYMVLFCIWTDYFALLPAGTVHQDVKQNVSFLKSFREKIFPFYCSQPSFDWRRNWNQSCICIRLFFTFQNTCAQNYRPDSFHHGLCRLVYLCKVLGEIILNGSTIIRTNVKFGPNAGFGPKTNWDQKFKFGPKFSGY